MISGRISGRLYLSKKVCMAKEASSTYYYTAQHYYQKMVLDETQSTLQKPRPFLQQDSKTEKNIILFGWRACMHYLNFFQGFIKW